MSRYRRIATIWNLEVNELTGFMIKYLMLDTGIQGKCS